MADKDAAIDSSTTQDTEQSNSDDTTKHHVVVYMFEIGCIVHSILMGFTLGVNTDDRGEAISMMVALMFHQALEGLALGTFIVKAHFGALKAVVLVATYGLTLPIGIAIGIGVASSYEDHSTTSLAVQGTLNCFSGGLLLYIALVQMIAHDFMVAASELTGGWTVRVLSYVALTIGIAAMAIIAIFEGDSHGH